MIFDTHCHLNHFEVYKDYMTLLKRAQLVGVTKIMVVGYDYKSSLQAVELAHKHPGVIYAAVGIHPSECLGENNQDLTKIEELAKDDCVKAIGEIGLDYYWDEAPCDTQKSFFEKQIRIAHKLNKPIIIHMRDAEDDVIKVLEKNKAYLTKGIMHCYSGREDHVKLFVDLGMYISFAGPLTFKNAKAPKETIKKVPLDRLLVETDTPYLAPHPLRGRPNEPSYITLIINEAAEQLNMSYKEVVDLCYHNALKVFDIYEED